MSDTLPTPAKTRIYEQHEFARSLAVKMIRELNGRVKGKTISIHVPSEAGALKEVEMQTALYELLNLLWAPAKGKLEENEGGLAGKVTRRKRDITKTQENDTTAQIEQLTKDFAAAGPETLDLMVDVMAHLSQLHQMAGLLAREALIRASQQQEQAEGFTGKIKSMPNLDSVTQLLAANPKAKLSPRNLAYKEVDEALARIGTPAFEVTDTAHPTFVNSVPSMRAQRHLAQALLALTPEEMKSPKGLNKVNAEFKAFADTPLLPMKNGKPTPLKVPEEVEMELYFLDNIYEDVVETHHAFDQGLKTAYGDAYHPEKLALNLKFHGWPSGDKDGNKKINAATTLDAVAQRQSRILSRYAKDLEALNLPDTQEVSQKIKRAAEGLTVLEKDLRAAMGEKHHLSAPAFEQFKTQITSFSDEIDMPSIIETVTQAYHHAPAEKRDDALNLLRRMRIFGKNFGHIEYRETAEEYERVVGRLIPEYDVVLQDVNHLRDEREEAKKTAARPKDAEEKTKAEQMIQTTTQELDRLESTRVEILNSWLADPQKLRQVTAGIQAELASVATAEYSGETADPITYQTLRRMEIARDFPDMVRGNVLAECRGTSNMLETVLLQQAVATERAHPNMEVIPLFEEYDTLTQAPKIVHSALENTHYEAHLNRLAHIRKKPLAQQIQFAASDNFKRIGIAARGEIYHAHETVRAMFHEFNEAREKAQKSPIAVQFYKGSSQSDHYRGGGRAYSADVNEYGTHDFMKATFQGGDLLNFFNISASLTRLLVRNFTNSVKRLALPALSDAQLKTREDASEKVRTAFDESKNNYINNYFYNDKYIKFLNQLDYAEISTYGNLSSRAPKRGDESTVTTPAPITDINITRAIGYSKTLQQSETGGTWIGIGDIRQALVAQDARFAKPDYLSQNYDNLPMLRDIVDHLLFGLMRTDLNHVEEVTRVDGVENEFMPALRKDYVEAFRLAIEAYTGKTANSFPALKGVDFNNTASVQEAIKHQAFRQVLIEEVFPHAAEVIHDQNGMLKFSHFVNALPTKGLTPTQSDTRKYLLHNMRASVHEGRLTQVEDTKYKKVYCDALNIPQPYDRKHSAGLGVAA